WERTLAADRLVLVPGDDPTPPTLTTPLVYTWVDPATGATLRELALIGAQVLVRDPGGGYLRVGGPDHAELDREGRLLRTVPRAIQPLAWPGARFLAVRGDDRFTVLRRPDLEPALAAGGNWSVDESTAALGPDALLVYEHRGADPLRIA